MVQTINFNVLDEEFQLLLDLKGRKTWRELLLRPLGIKAKRRKPGPRRELNARARLDGEQEAPD